MAGANRKKKQKATKAKGGSTRMTTGDRQTLQRYVRLVYAWRYVINDNAEERKLEGANPSNDGHGYNLLIPAPESRVDAAYAVATNTLMHWQVILVAYVNTPEGEYRQWTWVTSDKPIKAAGGGIKALLSEAYGQSRLAVEEDGGDCYARGVIMAPWESNHPVRPARLAARLKTKFRLSTEEVLALEDWDAPETVSIDMDLLEALRAELGMED